MSERATRETIASLQNDWEPIEENHLDDLSNLTREEQVWLNEAWNRISLDKRRRLVALMGERAEEDVQLDFTAVFRCGLQDSDAEVRRLSVDGLWEDESVLLIRPFLNLLREDESHAVRASAATALGRFVLQSELGYLSEERSQEVLDALFETVSSPELPVSVRRRAVESLGYSGDERVREVIARAYEDPAEEMRVSAIFAMGRSADEYWAGTVRLELGNENPALRYEAVRAAGELIDSRAVETLVRLLVDVDRQVREMAIWSLGQIGGPLARKALQHVAKGENRTMRRLARESLAEMDLLDEERPGVFVDPELYQDWGEDEDEEWDDLLDDEDGNDYLTLLS